MSYEYELCTHSLTLTAFEYEKCVMKGFRVIVNDGTNKKPLYVTIVGEDQIEIVWPQLSLVSHEYELCGYSEITLTTFEYELCTLEDYSSAASSSSSEEDSSSSSSGI